MPKNADTDILRAISTLLQYHQELGIKEYPRTEVLERFLQEHADNSSITQPQASTPQQKETITTPHQSKKHFFDAGLAAKVSLHDVREELGDCTRCPLHETRSNIVFGQGPSSARLMIVADAPAGEDDRCCAPLQGDAGVLLDKMLAAIGLSRDEVYITTLVKCFPGPHAKPREHEITTCLPFLFRQVEIICPAVICTMGMLSAQTLLHSSKSLFQLRGRFYDFNDLCSTELERKIVVMPSLHPSLLLQNVDLKKASWQDLQMIQKKIAEEKTV